MAERITVNAPGGAYDIVIAPGLLQDRAQLTELLGPGRVAIVTNETIAPLHGEALQALLPDAVLITVPDGERYKTLETVADLYDQFISAGLDRKSTVLALGGGVVGDAAGFAAASYMRGVRLVQAPTSLLSMVDSSVGGKVGVDLPQGKNLVGAFKQPAVVLIDPSVLATLPAEEWRNGLGEVIKHGLLADASLLDTRQYQLDHAADLVARAVRVKVDVVEQDPYEQGIRAHLNLGHTFAHAVEQVTAYAWPHGAAVGFGLLAATQLSHRLGLCDAALPERVEGILSEVGLPCRSDGLESAALYAAMSTDKKWESGLSRFVLLRDVGQATVLEEVPRADVLAVLDGLR